MCSVNQRTITRQAWSLVAVTIFAFLLYFALVRIFEPPYWAKSLGKFALFALIGLADQKIQSQPVLQRWLDRFLPKQINWRQLAIICLGGAALVLVSQLLYQPISRFFEIEHAVDEIVERTDDTRNTAIAALIYIPTINAWAEEAFFRGLLCLELCRRLPRRSGSLVAAGLFALYHLVLFRSWFSVPIFFAVMAGLFIAGLILNQVVLKDQHIWRAWLIHAWFNVAAISISFHFYPS